jgi:hypothetical protein
MVILITMAILHKAHQAAILTHIAVQAANPLLELQAANPLLVLQVANPHQVLQVVLPQTQTAIPMLIRIL